ncbi:tyrosine-type recombinase/integrase [Saccharopolyspora shandongensis]|uniref:tyrosine-type recombinase/integrase n=1 Tax=Saccharopolyspora shandongensis TaxID=418495 RepID=UPI0033EA950D
MLAICSRSRSTINRTGPLRWSGLGGIRDQSNTRRVLRETRGSEGLAWVTSHVFRKTSSTILDKAGLTARLIANQLGHSQPSMTQDVYMGREAVSRDTAEALGPESSPSSQSPPRQADFDVPLPLPRCPSAPALRAGKGEGDAKVTFYQGFSA